MPPMIRLVTGKPMIRLVTDKRPSQPGRYLPRLPAATVLPPSVPRPSRAFGRRLPEGLADVHGAVPAGQHGAPGACPHAQPL